MSASRAHRLKLLAFIQNAPENLSQDIMSIAGLMTDLELAKHIIRYAGYMTPGRRSTFVRLMRELVAEAA